jgi:ankyrin repeat protein
VLIKHAAKTEKQRRTNELVVSYFVHGQGTELQKAPLGVLRALMNSLLGYFPAHLAKLTATFKDREERFGGYMANRWHWSCKELQESLLSVLVEGTQHRHVTIFVDALDECGEDSAKNLLAYFSEISRQVDAKGAHVKICLSSRHYPILGLENFPTISVEERNSEDIRWYVGERLRSIQPATRRQQIQDEILSKACGGFQWVFLITETLVGRHLAGKTLFKDISSCPQTLTELYATILNTGPEVERSQMTKLFQWILFAKRPLSAQELRDALAADADMSCTSVAELRSQESWSETLVDFERYVKYISRGLVEFHSREIWEQYEPGGEDSDREAQLIHQSVADFLLDKHLSKIDINQDGAAHIQISKSCFKYLALDEVLKGSRLSRGVLSSRYPLAPYGTRYVFRHILEAERSGSVQLNFLSLINWTPRSETVSKLAELWHILDPDNVHAPEGWPFLGSTELHVLAACGLESAFTNCLENHVGDADSRDTEGNTPLHLAIREGHQDIAMALLDQSYELRQQQGPTNDDIVAESQMERQHQGRRIGINAQNNEGETALDLAVLEKADATIERLIEAGADLKFMGRDNLLVFTAISSRNLDLLTLLIERDVSLDGAVYFAMWDYTRDPDHILKHIVETLLKFGATTNKPKTEDSWFSSHYEDVGEEFDENMRSDDDALHLATRFGSLPMVDLMISHGVAASVQNELGECPLLIAVQNGHSHLVQRFIELDPAAVESGDILDVTALEAAWGNNRLDLVEILLDKGLFEYPSPALNSFLLWLAKTDTLKFSDVTPGRGCDQVILLAEKRGTVFRLSLNLAAANVNERDENGRSVLWHAASKAHHTLVNMLLSTGKVDLNAKNNHGCSPLWAAAKHGHATVFKLLLDTKQVDPHVWPNSDVLEPWLCKTEEYEAIVKMWLGIVDINMKDESGTPLLLHAVARHDMPMVRVLLNTGRVDVNCTDKKGYTPLARAAEYGYVDIAKLLLEVGKADVNGKQIGRLTPLYLATQAGYETLIELLRAHGAVTWEDEAIPNVAPADAYPIVLRPRSMIAEFCPNLAPRPVR